MLVVIFLTVLTTGNYSILAVPLCLIFVNDDEGNRAEEASDVRENKHCGVK